MKRNIVIVSHATLIMPYDSSIRMETCDIKSYNERITRDDLTLWRIVIVLNIIETIKSKHKIDNQKIICVQRSCDEVIQ